MKDAESRLLEAYEKMNILEALFQGLEEVALTGPGALQKIIEQEKLVFGLAHITKSIRYDMLAAMDGGYPFELREYSLEDLEREIESRKEAPGSQPVSEDSEADRQDT